MTTYSWGSWGVNHFEMRIRANSRAFSSPYTKQTQVVDMLGERWAGVVGLVPTGSDVEAGAREAFFDRLKGQANLFSIWNIKRPNPNGTMRGAATVTVKNSSAATVTVKNSSAVTVTVQSANPSIREVPLQFASTIVISTQVGKTLLAGDHIGITDGTQKQLCRVMGDATADGNGRLEVEVLPRPRWQFNCGALVIWDKPSVDVMLAAGDGVSMAHIPGWLTEGPSFDFVEA